MKRPATRVFRKIIPNGVEISLDRRNFQINYPAPVWKEFPENFHQNFADSLAYLLTAHLVMNGHEKLIYNFPHPPIEPYVFESMMYSFGETTMVSDNSLKVSELLKTYYNRNLNTEFVGRPRFSRLASVNRNTKNRVLIPFSFGKDSLLSFALSKELGIDPQPVFFQEPKSPFENRHKSKLADKFAAEFNIDVIFFPVPTGRLRRVDGDWWGWDMLFTQYSLMLVPYLFFYHSRYLFWSHEQDCNDFFENEEGYTINPVFEQSDRWLLTLNNIIRSLGSNTILASVIEPIHEIATTWILHHRYPHVGKFQFSCFAEEKNRAGRRWCGVCEKCATIYLFLTALGINPESVGLRENMFTIPKRNLYVLLDGSGRTDAWRDEQLLGFFLAYKNRAKGKLIDDFKKNYFTEAIKRERELRQKFFGIHSSDTLTYELKKPLLKIFQEELSPLQ